MCSSSRLTEPIVNSDTWVGLQAPLPIRGELFMKVISGRTEGHWTCARHGRLGANAVVEAVTRGRNSCSTTTFHDPIGDGTGMTSVILVDLAGGVLHTRHQEENKEQRKEVNIFTRAQGA